MTKHIKTTIPGLERQGAKEGKTSLRINVVDVVKIGMRLEIPRPTLHMPLLSKKSLMK